MLWKAVVMLTLFAAFGCASGPSLQHAITLHNDTKHVLDAVDRVWTPAYLAAQGVADQAYPDDEKAFQQAMAPFDRVNERINTVRQGEQLLHLGIEQWQLGADSGDLLREVADCAATGMSDLGEALVSLPDGTALYATAKVLAGELATLAAGAHCADAAREISAAGKGLH